MNNELEDLVIKYLSTNCEQNSYTIVEISEVKDYINKTLATIKKVDIKQTMQSLYNQKIIDIKYYDDNVYCLLVLKSYEEITNENKKSCVSQTANTTNKINYLFIFLFAFLADCLSNLILYFLIK